MLLKNAPDSFGLVSRLLHWGMAILVIFMLVLGLNIANIEPGLSNLWLYGLHKTVGFVVFALLLLRIIWHLHSPAPKPLGPPGPIQWAARAAHLLLYALVFAIPIAGWAGSSATGLDIVIADRWIVPPIAEVSEAGEAFWFGLHRILTRLLIGLLAVHILAAFKREIAGDGTLKRMLRGRV